MVLKTGNSKQKFINFHHYLVNMVRAKKLGLAGIVLAMVLSLFSSVKAKAEEVIYNIGNLKILNVAESDDYDISFWYNSWHYPGGKEGLGDYDIPYSSPIWNIKDRVVQVVSTIPGYRLRTDTRPLESLNPINLELFVHTKFGDPVTESGLVNYLKCNLPEAGEPDFWDFSPKPITLWEKIPDPNDPNEYGLAFLGDIREATDRTEYFPNGIPTAIIPLPDLNGTYESEDPYMYAQVSFDKFPGDFNWSGKPDLIDLSYIGQDWMTTDVNAIADISGPNGLPDGKVNYYDLSLLTRDWLRDSNDPNTW